MSATPNTWQHIPATENDEWTDARRPPTRIVEPRRHYRGHDLPSRIADGEWSTLAALTAYMEAEEVAYIDSCDPEAVEFCPAVPQYAAQLWSEHQAG